MTVSLRARPILHVTGSGKDRNTCYLDHTMCTRLTLVLNSSISSRCALFKFPDMGSKPRLSEPFYE